MAEQQKPNVLDAMNFLYKSLEKANKFGNKMSKDGELESLFTMEETANLFSCMVMTKKYFESVVKQQEQQEKKKQLSPIQENTETI
jgi:hypothetical protein